MNKLRAYTFNIKYVLHIVPFSTILLIYFLNYWNTPLLMNVFYFLTLKKNFLD